LENHPLELSTLGLLELRRGPGVVLARRRKELCLLAYLARQEGRPTERRVAAALLWGDRDEQRSRVSLRQAIFELRSALGDSLETSGTTLALRPGGVVLDVSQFEAEIGRGDLAAAVGRWHGPFLPAAEELGDERWRTWLEGERAGLRARLVAALTRLARDAEGRGDWQAVADWSARQLESDQYDEAAGTRLVKALQRLGRPTEAAAMAARFRDRLRRDLDADPGAAFQEAVAPEVEASLAGPRARGLVTPDLVGRESALAAVAEAWQAVVAGRGGRVVIVNGETGIGKSRLLAESERRLAGTAPRMASVSARAFDSERAQPWSAVRPILDRLAESARGMVAAPPEVVAAAAAVIPELADRFGRPPQPAAAGHADPALAIVRLIAEAAAEQPVALFLDDAPNADPDSIAVLSALTRRPPPGLLLLLTGNPGGWNRFGDSANLAKGRDDIRRIELTALTTGDVRSLVESMAPFAPGIADHLSRLVHPQVGGVPALVIGAVQHLADSGRVRPGARGLWEASGPLEVAEVPALREQVRLTLRSLPDNLRHLLGLAAVVGPEVESGLLERLSGVGPEEYQRLVGDLLAGRHLREVRERATMLEFPSEAVRQGIYHELAPSARRQLHAQVGITLGRLGGPAAEITRHRVLAGRQRRPAAGVAAALVAVLGGSGLVWTATRPARPVAPGTGVILAEPINQTGDSLYGEAIVSAARIALQQTGHVWVAPANQIDEALKRMGRPADSRIAGELAREIALRENLPIVVELSAAQTGSALVLSGRLIESVTGRDLASYSARAQRVDDLTDQVAAVTRRMLRDLGSEAKPVDSLPSVTTPSFEALRLFALGEAAWNRRNWEAALGYWRRALDLDSTFAMAHASLGLYNVFPANDRPTALAHYEAAERFADRLTERERLVIEALRLELLGKTHETLRAAAALAERFPTPATVAGHALALYRAGRCPEAIPVYRRAIAMRATAAVPWVQLATCLQLVDSAESAVAAYQAAGQLDSTILFRQNVNQEYGRALLLDGRPAAAESAFRQMANAPNAQDQARGLRSLAYLAISQRRLHEAVSSFDEATVRVRAAGVTPLSAFRNQLLVSQSLVGSGRSAAARARLVAAERTMVGQRMNVAFSHYGGRAFLATGDLAGARRWLDRARKDLILTNRLDSTHYRLLQSAIARAEGQPRQALELLGPEPTAEAIEYLGAYCGERGRAYLALGSADSALTSFQRAARYFTWGFELQYEWEQLPLLIAEAAIAVNDSGLARQTLGSLVERWSGADSTALDVRRARALLARLEGPVGGTPPR
jgi:DNA-binding SARP family transcriptional activator/tetratricopeptide (TPR) repeat protein